jgi:hypothetical protein
MGENIFSLYDIIQLGLMLLACYCCKVYGYQKGIVDTLEYFDKNQIIEIGTQEQVEENEKN